jgi:cell shape-determining protein MreC
MGDRSVATATDRFKEHFLNAVTQACALGEQLDIARLRIEELEQENQDLKKELKKAARTKKVKKSSK